MSDNKKSITGNIFNLVGKGRLSIIGFVAIVGFIMYFLGGCEKEKVAEKKEEKQEKQISYTEQLKSMSREERLKEFASIFNSTQKMGSIWSKENNFCGKVWGDPSSPKTNSSTMPSDRYRCTPNNDTYTDDTMHKALVNPLIYVNQGYTFYNTTLNGFYFTAVDREKWLFINNEDAVNFFNSIYGEENITRKLEGKHYFETKWNLGYPANNWPTVQIAYGCKAYDINSPSGDEVNPNYDNWKSLVTELSPNLTGANDLQAYAGWEININDIKDLNRCVVVSITEEFYKAKDLAEEPDTSVTFSLMEVNPKFPYVLK
jgi:hypothetical protein